MKAKFYFSIMLLAVLVSVYEKVNAQAPDWAWAKGSGGTNYDYGYSVATDTSGNVFMTGSFASDSITFGTTTLANAGNKDIFLVKYDANGNVIWAMSFGGNGFDEGYSVSTDANGNVFMTGWFESDSITFGTTTLISAGGHDIFIIKYDANGNVLWAKSAGGTADDLGNSVSTDASGNVFITGFFSSDSITFGTTMLINSGSYDIFIVKYDASGNVIWAKCAGGTSTDFGNSVSTDINGNVFITGNFGSNSINFGTTTLTSTGNVDIFVVKYDSSGNVLWARGAYGTNADFSHSVATDATGNIFITGWFNSYTITFGTTVLTKTPGPSYFDIFIAKYDATGNELWAKSAGNYQDDYGFSVATDTSGNVFMTGYFSSFITFGTTTLTTIGGHDIFIMKYDASGNALWAKSAGGTNNDYGYSVATDASGNVFIAGLFISSTIVFGTTTLTNANAVNSDLFIAKLDNTTGLEITQNPNSISLYPNPATNNFTISLKDNKKVSITITDHTGKIIYATTSINTQNIEVNTIDFAAGVYAVQIQTGDFVETRKLIVAK